MVPWARDAGSRLCLAGAWGLVAFAAAAHGLLLARQPLPLWLLPACLAAGLAAGLLVRLAPAPRDVPADGGRPAPRWLVAAALLVFGAAEAALVMGSIATPDRVWDGYVSWSHRARYLEPPADLSHPFFTDPGVLAHSRGYPLLQPLCLGAGVALLGPAPGRLLFPALHLLLTLTVGSAVARAGSDRRLPWFAALAAGLTPMWLNPGGGSVDSGYAELFLATALAFCAGGLLHARADLLFAGAFLMPLIKPEGVPYGIVLCLVTTLCAPRRLHLAAVLGLAGALLAWLPLRGRLTGSEDFAPGAAVAVVVAAALSVALNGWVRRRAPGRLVLVACALSLAAAGAWFVLRHEDELTRSGDVLVVSVLEGLKLIPARARELPALVIGVLEQALSVRKLGLVFPLLLALAALPRAVAGRAPSRVLAAFLACGLAAVVAGLLLSPQPDLAHELRSRFDRLLLHWVGVAWILAGAWLHGTPLVPALAGSSGGVAGVVPGSGARGR